MTTIELTETQLELLREGAEQFGRCALILENTDGDEVYVAVSKTVKRGRPARKAAAAGTAPEPGLVMAERDPRAQDGRFDNQAAPK